METIQKRALTTIYGLAPYEEHLCPSGLVSLKDRHVNFEFKLMKQYSDNDGRYIIIDIEHHNNIYTIVNIYAPTRDKESDQIRVFQSLIKHLQIFSHENLIIGGDLNVYMNPKLDKLITNDNLNYHQEIKSFLETEELLDIWKVINPDTGFYTWCLGNNQQSRLDYFFYIETFNKCIE